jgi:sterol desaturase/sphingolipid hydroxylase (fatty acid hydroxylase superfamily)
MSMPKDNSLTLREQKHHGVASRLFLVVTVVIVAVATVMAIVFPSLIQSVTGVVEILQGFALRTCTGIFPSSVHPICQHGINTYLSPWLVLLVVLILTAERYLPAVREQPLISKGFVQDAIAWFVVNMAARALASAAMLAIVFWVYSSYLEFATIEAALHWSVPIRVLTAVVVTDLIFWFSHYVRHKVPLFWVFHAVHHSQRQMNMFTDLRIHFVEYLVARPIEVIPLLMLSMNFELAFWIVLLRGSLTNFYHGNIRANLGPLKYILVTPQSHRIHHSKEPQHQDMNFGVTFTVWDRLFGTLWTDYEEYPHTGVADLDFPLEQRVDWYWSLVNYFRQVIYPFKQALAIVRNRGRATAATRP